MNLPISPEISISIINTNNREVVMQCLKSIYQTVGGLNIEVIVVNNGCTDGSVEAIARNYPQVKEINNPLKLGFSTNNNLAFAQSTGKNFLLLNDDTILLDCALHSLLEFLNANPKAGVVGAALLNSDGSAQKCYDHSPHPLYDGLQPLSEILFPLPQSEGRPLEVASVSGACMLVRGAAIKDVGLLDTRFDPLYSEEVDWCFRIHKAGWKIFHLPEAHVIHIGGSTMNRMPKQRYERIFEKKALFFRKHYGKRTVLLYKVSLFLANLVKSAVWAILVGLGKADARDELDTHWNMVRRSLLF